jgi:hypothetical protein
MSPHVNIENAQCEQFFDFSHFFFGFSDFFFDLSLRDFFFEGLSGHTFLEFSKISQILERKSIFRDGYWSFFICFRNFPDFSPIFSRFSTISPISSGSWLVGSEKCFGEKEFERISGDHLRENFAKKFLTLSEENIFRFLVRCTVPHPLENFVEVAQLGKGTPKPLRDSLRKSSILAMARFSAREIGVFMCFPRFVFLVFSEFFDLLQMLQYSDFSISHLLSNVFSPTFYPLNLFSRDLFFSSEYFFRFVFSVSEFFLRGYLVWKSILFFRHWC